METNFKQQALDKFHKRDYSWSQHSSFLYDPKQWYDSYILDIKQSSPEMEFGSKIGKRIENDPTYLPEIIRHNKMEHGFKVNFNGITLVGYADTFCDITNKKLGEFKTGVKKWDQKRVNEHGQLTMYCLMNYITNKIKPEEMDITLYWMPTKKSEEGDFNVTIEFDGPIKKFKTKRTMTNILKFGAEINETYKKMELYIQNYDK
jgi:hypothetical protein